MLRNKLQFILVCGCGNGLCIQISWFYLEISLFNFSESVTRSTQILIKISKCFWHFGLVFSIAYFAEFYIESTYCCQVKLAIQWEWDKVMYTYIT